MPVGQLTRRTYYDETKNEEEKSIEKTWGRKEKFRTNDLAPKFRAW